MTTSGASGHRRSKLFSILALVAGIIGALASFTGFAILLPIAAVVFGIVGARRERYARRYWLTGIVLGIVGIIVSCISLFLQYLSIMASAGFSAA